MIDLYSIGSRVVYGEFLPATVALVRSVVARASGVDESAFTLSVSTSSGNTAAVACERDNRGSLISVMLSMPAYPPDHIVTGEFAKTMLGFLLHEIAHMTFTNTDACARQKMQGDQQRSHFLNVAEDYFIEYRASSKRNPLTSNCGELLGRLNDEVQQGLEASMEQAVAARDLRQQGYLYLLAGLNREGRQGLALQRPLEVVRSVMDVGARSVVDSLMDKLQLDGDAAPARCIKNTAARMLAAAEAWARLGQLQEQQQQQQQQEQEKGEPQEGEGEKGEPGKGEPQEGEGEKGEPGKGEPQEGEGEGEGEKGEPDKTSQGDKPREGQGRTGGLGNVDVDALRRKLLDAQAPDATPEQRDVGARLLRALVSGIEEGSRGDRLAEPTAALAVSRMTDEAALADAARRCLRSTDNDTHTRRLVVGRFDRRAVVRAEFGALDVFARRDYQPGVRTAVLVMLDASDSMAEMVLFGGLSVNRFQACVGACSTMVPALERAGCEVAVAMFGDFGGAKAVAPVKRFNDRMPEREQLASLVGRVWPMGGTPMMVPALWSERTLLANTWATRRVVVWLCDGMPRETAPVVHEFVSRRGAPVEHVGIGLQCDVSPCFDQAARVDDLALLPDAFERLLIRE